MEWQWLDALLIAAAALLAAAHIARQVQSWKRSKLNLPPGPPGLPVLGNLLLFGGRDPPRTLLDLTRRYGPVMSLRMGSKLAVVISSGEAAWEVLKAQDEHFSSRPHSSAIDTLSFLDGSFAFSPSTPRHQALRKTLVSELLVPSKLRRHAAQRAGEVRAAVRSVLPDAQRRSAVDVHVKLASVTLNVMTQVTMSKRFCSFDGDAGGGGGVDPDAAEFMDVVAEANRVLGIKMFGDYVPRLAVLDALVHRARILRCRKRLSRFFDGAIAEHRLRRRQRLQQVASTATGDGAATTGECDQQSADFIDALLELPDEPGIPKDNVIKGLISDSLFAGIDTPAITAEWAMAELLRNPECMRRAQAELDHAVGRDRQVAEDDLPRLPYLQAVMRESLRLHPVAPLLIPHLSTRDCRVAGFHIPAGTTAFVHIWAIHRSEAVYHDPEQFDPERFHAKDVDLKGLKSGSLDLLPFGAGRRMCPASTFGLTMATFLVAALIHSFDWELPDGQSPQDLDMSGQLGLTLPKTNHLMAVPTPRLPLTVY